MASLPTFHFQLTTPTRRQAHCSGDQYILSKGNTKSMLLKLFFLTSFVPDTFRGNDVQVKAYVEPGAQDLKAVHRQCLKHQPLSTK